MKYIKNFEDFGPDHIGDVNLPYTVSNEMLKAWFNDKEDTDKGSSMIRYAKDLYLSILIGDDTVWTQEERTTRVLNVLNDFYFLPWDIKMPYNYMWMEAKKNGGEKLSKFWNNAFKDPEVKKSFKGLIDTVSDLGNKINKEKKKKEYKEKEKEEFKKVNKELTKGFDLNLNSVKYK